MLSTPNNIMDGCMYRAPVSIIELLVLSGLIMGGLGVTGCDTDAPPPRGGDADAGAQTPSDVDFNPQRDTSPTDTSGESDAGPDDGEASSDVDAPVDTERDDAHDDEPPRDIGPRETVTNDANDTSETMDTSDGELDTSRDTDRDTSPMPDGDDDTSPPDVRRDAPEETGVRDTSSRDTTPSQDAQTGGWGPVDSASKRIGAGAEHTCFLRSQGGVYCWGSDRYGQLGIGGSSGKTTPQRVSLTGTVREVDGGEQHTCVRFQDGTLKCWGFNDEGQVGKGSTMPENQTRPVDVQQISDAVDICTEGKHSCAVNSVGEVSCWGENEKGQLGADPNNLPNSAVPRRISGITDAVRVTCGEEFVCALREGGRASCWGYNNKGQLGDGSTQNRSNPVDVQVPPSVKWVDLAGGVEHACGLDQSGTLWCWGSDGADQLGLGSGDQTTTSPREATVLNVPPEEVTAGNEFTCIREPGGVQCWGDDSLESLGNGSNGSSATPAQVDNVGAAVGLEVGEWHSCALAGTSLYCWGFNVSDQVGHGNSRLESSGHRVSF